MIYCQLWADRYQRSILGRMWWSLSDFLPIFMKSIHSIFMSDCFKVKMFQNVMCTLLCKYFLLEIIGPRKLQDYLHAFWFFQFLSQSISLSNFFIIFLKKLEKVWTIWVHYYLSLKKRLIFELNHTWLTILKRKASFLKEFLPLNFQYSEIPFTDDLFHLKFCLWSKIDLLLFELEVFWFQKSRIFDRAKYIADSEGNFDEWTLKSIMPNTWFHLFSKKSFPLSNRRPRLYFFFQKNWAHKSQQMNDEKNSFWDVIWSNWIKFGWVDK